MVSSVELGGGDVGGEARRPCLDGERDDMDALGDIIELYDELDDDPAPPAPPPDDESDDEDMFVCGSLLLLNMKLTFEKIQYNHKISLFIKIK